MTPVQHAHAPADDETRRRSAEADATDPRFAEGASPPPPATPEAEDMTSLQGALGVFRRGLAESPELRVGLVYTIGLAIAMALGRLLVPVLLQQVVDRGLLGADGFRPAFVYPACAAAAVAVVFIYVAARFTYARMVTISEGALASLRVRAFAHIHELSIAEQTAHKRGVFVSRVTADIDTLAQFLEWGGLSWVISGALMLGCAAAMFVYSWQLAMITIAVVAPIVLVLRTMQRAMLGAYDRWRNRVSDTLSEVSESVMGAAEVRAYGLEERTDRRLRTAIAGQYGAEMYAQRFAATVFPIADLFGAMAIAAVVAVGAHYGRAWGLSLGDLVAFLFLVTLFLQPLMELSEVFEQTQTAIAGWRKVLTVIDLPVELDEPAHGVSLPAGPLPLRLEGVAYAYREGGPVLEDIDVDVAAGAHVAVVGETGSGKTTFARLVSRLADPSSGRILVGGIDLRDASPLSRRHAVRMVPQDGFLFDTSIRENVRFGGDGVDDGDIVRAFVALGLREWLDSLPEGLDTRVGERGENISVGERQLVALARAQVANPGLLILDEATSAVDPETERVIADALEHLSRGRTTVTIAHRLSTAEAADSVLVFDAGRIVERGDHRSLVAARGVYASLYESWLGNTRARA
jgi:ATP-binding cassette subfamily B protein